MPPGSKARGRSGCSQKPGENPGVHDEPRRIESIGSLVCAEPGRPIEVHLASRPRPGGRTVAANESQVDAREERHAEDDQADRFRKPAPGGGRRARSAGSLFELGRVGRAGRIEARLGRAERPLLGGGRIEPPGGFADPPFIAAALVPGCAPENGSSQAWSSTAAEAPSTRWRPFFAEMPPRAGGGSPRRSKDVLIDQLDPASGRSARACANLRMRWASRLLPLAIQRQADQKTADFSLRARSASSERSFFWLPPASGGRGSSRSRPARPRPPIPPALFPYPGRPHAFVDKALAQAPARQCAEFRRIRPKRVDPDGGRDHKRGARRIEPLRRPGD